MSHTKPIAVMPTTRFGCGCTAHAEPDVNGIAPWLEHCPKHKAASALREALRATTTNGHYNECLAGQRGYGECSSVCKTVMDAIAQAEGLLRWAAPPLARTTPE